MRTLLGMNQFELEIICFTRLRKVSPPPLSILVASETAVIDILADGNISILEFAVMCFRLLEILSLTLLQ